MNTHQSTPLRGAGMIASLILMLLPLAASANTYLSNIRLRMEMPAVVSPNQEIYVDFQYSTNQSPHMLVFITPLFEGNYITAYASGSSHYTPGSGFGSGFIRLNAGQKVDQLAVFAIDSDMKVILDKVLLPVDIECAEDGAVITGYSTDQPAGFAHSEYLTVTVEYDVNTPGGAYLAMNPMSGGSPTPDYFGDSEVLVSGGGIFDYDFKVSSGINVAVDAIRIQFLEPGTLAVLKEYVVPVEYYWSSAGLQPHLSALDYETGLVSVVMQYESTVQMRVILSPESDGPVNDWEVSESPVLLGGGSRSQSTGILDPEDGTVTGIRVRVLAYPSDDELHNFVVPIYPPVFRKAAHHFEEVRIAPATEGEIPFHQSVTVDLDWFSEEPADKVLKVYPVVESGPTSNYVKSPAGLAGTSGPAAVEFCLYNEEVYHITGVQLRLYKQSDMSVLAEYVYPVDLWHIPAVPVTTDVTCPSGDDVHVYGGVAPATTWRIEMGDNLSGWPDAGPWQYSYNGSVHYLDPDAMIFHDRRFYRISNYTTIDWGKP